MRSASATDRELPGGLPPGLGSGQELAGSARTEAPAKLRGRGRSGRPWVPPSLQAEQTPRSWGRACRIHGFLPAWSRMGSVEPAPQSPYLMTGAVSGWRRL